MDKLALKKKFPIHSTKNKRIIAPQQTPENQLPFDIKEEENAKTERPKFCDPLNPKKYQYFVKPQNRLFSSKEKSNLKIEFRDEGFSLKPNLVASLSNNQYSKSLLSQFSLKNNKEEETVPSLSVKINYNGGGYCLLSPKSAQSSNSVQLRATTGRQKLLHNNIEESRVDQDHRNAFIHSVTQNSFYLSKSQEWQHEHANFLNKLTNCLDFNPLILNSRPSSSSYCRMSKYSRMYKNFNKTNFFLSKKEECLLKSSFKGIISNESTSQQIDWTSGPRVEYGKNIVTFMRNRNKQKKNVNEILHVNHIKN